jgi:mediator of RNA polymerase II transcription subunit 10
LIVQSHDHQGTSTANAQTQTINNLVRSLNRLKNSAPELAVELPREIIQYVEHGRNPDIYTREFVELVQKANQRHKGRAEAFGRFRDVLAKEIAGAVPEVKEDVSRVVRFTGGDAGVLGVKEEVG